MARNRIQFTDSIKTEKMNPATKNRYTHFPSSVSIVAQGRSASKLPKKAKRNHATHFFDAAGIPSIQASMHSTFGVKSVGKVSSSGNAGVLTLPYSQHEIRLR